MHSQVHHRIILFQFGIAAYVETTNFLLDVSASYSALRQIFARCVV